MPETTTTHDTHTQHTLSNNNNERNNHDVATEENFYCKSGFSFAPFCGILRFFRCRLPAWLLFTFCLTQNSTRFPLSPHSPLPLWSPLLSPLKPLETKWCSWLRPSAKMFVTTQRQRRQVVPKELPCLWGQPPAVPSHCNWVRVQRQRRKEAES